ncbi:hypothetical protein IT571_00815 [Candidatus Sumerlaeota bacterium]|nr:hypothetical protein [Candidatus Sumerlaeota bacterium]
MNNRNNMAGGAARLCRRWAASFALVSALVLALAGCHRNRPGIPDGMEGINYPPALAPLGTKLMAEGQRNWVLNLNEIAVAAIKMNEREIAKRALDESLLEINAVFGETPEARKARNVFFNEDVKLFKGDPYERSMAFFYRGVLYMQDEDWENARACFRSANLQDSFAEEEQNRADWVIFDYLISVCEMQMGREFYAEEAFDRAMETITHRPGVNRSAPPIAYLPPNQPNTFHRTGGPRRLQSAPTKPPPGAPPDGGGVTTAAPPDFRLISPETNLLVITGSGEAPQKLRVGDYGQYLGYQRGIYRGDPVVQLSGVARPATELDSVYFQASTRGGRPFDRIQGRKVVFKKTTEAIGMGSTLLGMQVLSASDGGRGSGQQAVAGVALIAAGLGVSAFSSLISTKADIRQWTSLPDTVGIVTSDRFSGDQTIRVTIPGSGTVTKNVHLPAPKGGLVVALALPAPNPAITISPFAEMRAIQPAPQPLTTSTNQPPTQETQP